MNKRKKVFIVSLALSALTMGGFASAGTLVQSQNVKVYFNQPDNSSMFVIGYENTSTLTTESGSYLEKHYAIDKANCGQLFYAYMKSVKPWYQPDVTKDTSSQIGTLGAPGWNRGSFNANEKLRTDFSVNGYNGSSMTEQSSTEKE